VTTHPLGLALDSITFNTLNMQVIFLPVGYGKGVKGRGRQGFKASANRISVRLRRGQELPAHAPIDLAVVAARLQNRDRTAQLLQRRIYQYGPSQRGDCGAVPQTSRKGRHHSAAPGERIFGGRHIRRLSL
jgi:hypothetical protein